jgi:hypothetical protein
VPGAARRDPALYDLLALVDALRIGQTRERSLAEKKMTKVSVQLGRGDGGRRSR